MGENMVAPQAPLSDLVRGPGGNQNMISRWMRQSGGRGPLDFVIQYLP